MCTKVSSEKKKLKRTKYFLCLKLKSPDNTYRSICKECYFNLKQLKKDPNFRDSIQYKIDNTIRGGFFHVSPFDENSFSLLLKSLSEDEWHWERRLGEKIKIMLCSAPRGTVCYKGYNHFCSHILDGHSSICINQLKLIKDVTDWSLSELKNFIDSHQNSIEI